MQKEKQKYEEIYLIRLSVRTVERHRQRKLTPLGILCDDILRELLAKLPRRHQKT